METLYDRLKDQYKVGIGTTDHYFLKDVLSKNRYWLDVTYGDAQLVCTVLDIALVDFRNIFN